MLATKFILLKKTNIKRKIFIVFILFIIIIFLFNFDLKPLNVKKSKIGNNSNVKYKNSKIIEENYFIIDSNNLENIKSHMYGFSVSKNGILTDNYFKQIGEYDLPEPQGAFVMIRNIGNEILINQDFYGCFGIYIYENKESNYFVLSNSFLLIEEYLLDKQNISFNKDYADNLIITHYLSYSLGETLIKEINQIPTNVFLVINKKNKNLKINYIDYKENTILLDSEEGLKIIDKWIDKWGYILRSLKKKTDNISFDLSGGFDTRMLLTILLNSGINPNEINIFSRQDKVHDHEVDFEIAKNISLKYGFKLNNYNLNRKGNIWTLQDSLFNSLYVKLGFHKEFYLTNKFYTKPLFTFRGSNGESLRGMPHFNINGFIQAHSNNNVPKYKKEFYNSSMRLIKRSISFLKDKKTFDDSFDIASTLHCKALGKNHFGKSAIEKFTANIFRLDPLMDPDIKTIKYNINGKTPHDLISYIFIRFGKDLINFPFQGKRKLNIESIKNAKRLNQNSRPYVIKSDYNAKFYIDSERTSPSLSSKNDNDAFLYLTKLCKSSRFVNILNNMYDNNVYNWANKYSIESNYFPLRHYYALLAIVITLENLSLNQKYMKNSTNIENYKSSQIFQDLVV